MSIKVVDLVRVDQASRFSTGGFRVRLGANIRGICTNTQSYSAETLVKTACWTFSQSDFEPILVLIFSAYFGLSSTEIGSKLVYSDRGIEKQFYFIIKATPSLIK